jgi:hypothetical protein
MRHVGMSLSLGHQESGKCQDRHDAASDPLWLGNRQAKAEIDTDLLAVTSKGQGCFRT